MTLERTILHGSGPKMIYAINRLGPDMVVRLPRIRWAIDAVEKEQRWLPKLAPSLPVAIPVLLAKGAPAEG
jgi:aminoglycoside phosphotransferase (APT) family kinase protein